MAKRKFHLTETQQGELQRAFASSRDGPTRTRYQAIRLYGSGYEVAEIQAITGCSRSSLMGWCRQYREAGLPGLIDQRRGGNRAKLTAEQIADLSQRLRTYTPQDLFGSQAHSPDGQFWTVADLHRAVGQWYGVNYGSRSSLLRLLGLCGFSYQRPAKVFKSRSQAQVADFEEQLEKN